MDDTTLKDLQEEIFAKIPEIMAEINLNTTLDIKNITPKEEKNVKAIEEIVLDVKTEAIAEIDDLGDHINEISEFISLEESDFKDGKIYKVCLFTAYKPNSEVYILHSINFFPLLQIFYIFSIQVFFSSKEGGKMEIYFYNYLF